MLTYGRSSINDSYYYCPLHIFPKPSGVVNYMFVANLKTEAVIAIQSGIVEMALNWDVGSCWPPS